MLAPTLGLSSVFSLRHHNHKKIFNATCNVQSIRHAYFASALVIEYPLPEKEVEDKDQNGEYSMQEDDKHDDNTNVVQKRTINVSTFFHFFKIGCSIIGTGSQYVYIPEGTYTYVQFCTGREKYVIYGQKSATPSVS